MTADAVIGIGRAATTAPPEDEQMIARILRRHAGLLRSTANHLIASGQSHMPEHATWLCTRRGQTDGGIRVDGGPVELRRQTTTRFHDDPDVPGYSSVVRIMGTPSTMPMRPGVEDLRAHADHMDDLVRSILDPRSREVHDLMRSRLIGYLPLAGVVAGLHGHEKLHVYPPVRRGSGPGLVTEEGRVVVDAAADADPAWIPSVMVLHGPLEPDKISIYPAGLAVHALTDPIDIMRSLTDAEIAGIRSDARGDGE
jgi:hypothetical protein